MPPFDSLIGGRLQFFVFYMRKIPVLYNEQICIPHNSKKFVHCNENPIYVFPEKELRGLSPNFHIHDSVSDLNITTMSAYSAAGKYVD
jgi:hypothetical protein